jgi:hypothetical protein
MRRYTLFTRGEVPVAQEFSGTGAPGWAGSEFSAVRPECPSEMTPTGEEGSDVDGVVEDRAPA